MISKPKQPPPITFCYCFVVVVAPSKKDDLVSSLKKGRRKRTDGRKEPRTQNKNKEIKVKWGLPSCMEKF